MPDGLLGKTVIAIVGPTCSGKTALSLHLAKCFNGEVVACDSRTIYRYMDIGTAKPSMEERAGIEHHLFDVVEPDENFTVAQYKDAATEAIHSIQARGRMAVVCGGTGFYARALLEGLEIPAVLPDEQLRKSLTEFADEFGNEVLHRRLAVLDPVSAERLHANDRFRVIRALEVTMKLGKPFSQLATRVSPPFPTLWIGLTVSDRAYLKNAIETRMQAQLDAGLVDEVRTLYARYGSTRALIKAVNYREFIDHFDQKISFEQAIEECLHHNYQLARRQIMWFKTNIAINWFSIDSISSAQLFSHVEQLVEAECGQ